MPLSAGGKHSAFPSAHAGNHTHGKEMKSMITLTKLDGTYFALNPDLIETVIENPDTTIHLTMKRFHIVKESMEEVVQKIIEYRKEVNDVFGRR